MPLSLLEMIGMAIRKSPVGRIRKALARCEAAGLSVTAADLEAHSLAGGNPESLAEALVAAKELGVPAKSDEIAAVSLARHDSLELVLDASKERTAQFDTFSPTRDDRIRGFTKDGREVNATISVTYRLSPGQIAFKFDFRAVHERLAAAASVFINTAPDLSILQREKSGHEAELRQIVLPQLPGLNSVSLTYR